MTECGETKAVVWDVERFYVARCTLPSEHTNDHRDGGDGTSWTRLNRTCEEDAAAALCVECGLIACRPGEAVCVECQEAEA